jgi:hypothetical protein
MEFKKKPVYNEIYWYIQEPDANLRSVSFHWVYDFYESDDMANRDEIVKLWVWEMSIKLTSNDIHRLPD